MSIVLNPQIFIFTFSFFLRKYFWFWFTRSINNDGFFKTLPRPQNNPLTFQLRLDCAPFRQLICFVEMKGALLTSNYVSLFGLKMKVQVWYPVTSIREYCHVIPYNYLYEPHRTYIGSEAKFSPQHVGDMFSPLWRIEYGHPTTKPTLIGMSLALIASGNQDSARFGF